MAKLVLIIGSKSREDVEHLLAGLVRWFCLQDQIRIIVLKFLPKNNRLRMMQFQSSVQNLRTLYLAMMMMLRMVMAIKNNDDGDDNDDNDLSRSGTTWVRTMKRILLANQQLAEVRFWQHFYVCRIKLKETRYDNEI